MITQMYNYDYDYVLQRYDISQFQLHTLQLQQQDYSSCNHYSQFTTTLTSVYISHTHIPLLNISSSVSCPA